MNDQKWVTTEAHIIETYNLMCGIIALCRDAVDKGGSTPSVFCALSQTLGMILGGATPPFGPDEMNKAMEAVMHNIQLGVNNMHSKIGE